MSDQSEYADDSATLKRTRSRAQGYSSAPSDFPGSAVAAHRKCTGHSQQSCALVVSSHGPAAYRCGVAPPPSCQGTGGGCPLLLPSLGTCKPISSTCFEFLNPPYQNRNQFQKRNTSGKNFIFNFPVGEEERARSLRSPEWWASSGHEFGMCRDALRYATIRRRPQPPLELRHPCPLCPRELSGLLRPVALPAFGAR